MGEARRKKLFDESAEGQLINKSLVGADLSQIELKVLGTLTGRISSDTPNYTEVSREPVTEMIIGFVYLNIVDGELYVANNFNEQHEVYTVVSLNSYQPIGVAIETLSTWVTVQMTPEIQRMVQSCYRYLQSMEAPNTTHARILKALDDNNVPYTVIQDEVSIYLPQENANDIIKLLEEIHMKGVKEDG